MLDYYELYANGGIVQNQEDIESGAWWEEDNDKGFKAKIRDKAKRLEPYGEEMDTFFAGLGQGYSPAADFITNIMGQETIYGHLLNTNNMTSFGLSQVDPIRYQGLIDHYNDPGWKKRIDAVNDYMQSKAGYEDWDMLNLATMQGDKYTGFSRYADDPLTNFMLTRMLLTKDKKYGNYDKMPDIAQAGVWKDIWNTLEGKGKITEFTEKKTKYR